MQKLLPLSLIFVLLLAFLIPFSVSAAEAPATEITKPVTVTKSATVTEPATVTQPVTEITQPATEITESSTEVNTTSESINIYNAFKVLIFLISVLVGSALARAFSFWKW